MRSIDIAVEVIRGNECSEKFTAACIEQLEGRNVRETGKGQSGPVKYGMGRYMQKKKETESKTQTQAYG